MKRWHLVVLLLALVAALTAGCGGLTTGVRQEPSAAAPSSSAQPSPSQPAVEPPRDDAVRVAKDPADIPAPVGGREPQLVKVEMVAKELDGQLKDGITFTYWTFDGVVPGKMLRVRAGDTVELTLHNDPSSTQPHSIDLHAVNGPGGGAEATQVLPGETKTFRFKAMNPGVYVYHCATPYIPAHIANGMYGLIVVEPEGGLRLVDREFYVMQGEIYASLRPHQRGHARFSDQDLWNEQPNFVVFNGQYQALTGERDAGAGRRDRPHLHRQRQAQQRRRSTSSAKLRRRPQGGRVGGVDQHPDDAYPGRRRGLGGVHGRRARRLHSRGPLHQPGLRQRRHRRAPRRGS